MTARHGLRTRLLIALVALSIGVLFVTAAATALVARANAKDTALGDLERAADNIDSTLVRLLDTGTGGKTASERREDVTSLLGLAQTLPAFNAGVVVVPDTGTVEPLASRFPNLQRRMAQLDLPDALGLPPEPVTKRLDPATLQAGQEQAGTAGGVAFVARPVKTQTYGEVVVVLTQSYETRLLGGNGGVFLLIAGLAILAAVGVAYLLARRLTRPLATMQATANRIAGGDLTARVDLGRHPDDELAALARTLNGMTAELGYAQNLERSFLLSVSHDLRTPLTSIGGYAEAIEDGTITAPDEQVRAARIIRNEARRLERLVADLLDLARLAAHQFTVTPRPVDAGTVVREAVEAFGPQAAEIGVALSCRAEVALPIDVDADRLAQIVANLVENALKYATSSVSVGVAGTPAGCEITVDDDGPGIAPDDLPHVFDRLYTSRTTPGRAVGTGLGLAIVRELTDLMGGTVVATTLSTPTPGTRFVVRLPRA